MKNILFLFCLMLSYIFAGCSSTPAPKEVDPIGLYESKVKWSKFTEVRLEKALEANKPVYLFFTREGCSACLKFRIETLDDPIVSNLINEEFVPLIVRSSDERFMELAEEFGVEAIPTSLLIKPNGVVMRITGNVTPEDLLVIIYLLW